VVLPPSRVIADGALAMAGPSVPSSVTGATAQGAPRRLGPEPGQPNQKNRIGMAAKT
jgi:hypothetical protein